MARNTVKEISKDQAFALADEVARDIVANRALVAERDQHIQDVQDKYNPQIEANDKAIDAKIALVAMFAKSNRAEFFAYLQKTYAIIKKAKQPMSWEAFGKVMNGYLSLANMKTEQY